MSSSFPSCFAGDRFTRLLRAGPERSPPQAVTAELAAIPARFRAALTSRPASKPQSSQRNILSARSSVGLMTPQQEQVLLEGYQRPASTIRAPYSPALYVICRRNSAMPTSDTARARWRLDTMPLTFKSSMPITAKVLVIRVVSLCRLSRRIAAIRRCSRPSRAFAFLALREPRRLRAIALFARRSRFSAAACDFGPSITSPVESVARAETPRSTPTTASGCATGCTSSVSIWMATNHRPASQDTVARFSGPENRTASRIRTQPITGSLMRSPSVRNVPASLAAQKLGRSSLRLNRGNFARFSKKALYAAPRSMIASCTAALPTSYIQGNCSRLTAFSSRRSHTSDGDGPQQYSRFSAYSCRQRASAQFQAKRAVPAARAKYSRCAALGSSAILWASSIIVPLISYAPGIEQNGPLLHVVHCGQQSSYIRVWRVLRRDRSDDAVLCEDRAILALGQLIQQTLCLVAAAAIEAGAEHCDNLDHVGRKFLLEGWRLALVDDDDLNVLDFAQSEDQFRTEPQQPVLVGQHEAADALAQDHLKKLVQALLAVVEARAEIADDLVPPAFGRAEGFEQRGLAHQIILLVVAGDTSVADGGHVLVAQARDLANVVIPDPALAAPVRDQLSGRLPGAERLHLHAKHLRRFPYLHERHNSRD